MNEFISFGYWIKRRRKSLDLTQKELADLVGCASITIAKIEADQRRPSRGIGLLLAKQLQVPDEWQSLFVEIARGEKSSIQLRKIPVPDSFLIDDAGYGDDLIPGGEVRGAVLLSRISSGKLVGRRTELAMAIQAWETAGKGEAHVLVVSGEPGIGKSRLSAEILNHVRRRGGLTFAGNCFSNSERSYAPFSNLLQSVQNFPKNLTDVVLTDLRVITPQLETRFPDIPTRKTFDPLAEKLRLFESVFVFFSQVCAGTSAVILLEDIHWADSGSLELVKSLAHRFHEAGLGILLVLTMREELPTGSYDIPTLLDELQRGHFFSSIHLDRFDLEGTRELLASIFNQEITDGFISLIYRETQGNPFFVEEVCKDLIERGDIFWLNDRWERKELADIHIPKSLQVAVRARVHKLLPEVQEALLIAAVLGRRFEFGVLKEVSGFDEEKLISALESAENSQILYGVDGSGGDFFEFSHNIISTVLVEDANIIRRRKVHRRIVEVLERLHPAEHRTLAFHCREAAEPARAADYYCKAADRAMQAYSHEDAIRYFSEALSLIPEDHAGVCRLLLLRERVYDLRGERTLQARDLDDARARAAAAGEKRLQVEVELAFSDFNLQIPDPERSIEYAKRAIKLAEEENMVEAQAQAYMFWGRALSEIGSLQEARKILVMAGELGRKSGARLIEARSLINLGNVDYRQGEFEAAREKYEQALAPVRELGERRIECMAINNIGNAVWAGGGIEKALELYRKALSIAVEIGDRLNEGRTLSNIGSVYTEQFNYPEAMENLKKALALFQALRQRADELMALSHLGDTMESLGRYDEACDYKENALMIAQENQDVQSEAEMLVGLSHIRFHKGEFEESIRLAQRSIGVAHDHNLSLEAAEGSRSAGKACLALERWAEADSALSNALSIYKSIGYAAFSGEVLAELARSAELQGNHALALEYIDALLPDRNIKTLSNIDDPYICLGAYLTLRSDEPDLAARLLERGYAALHSKLERIHPASAREHYLKNIPVHRYLAEFWMDNRHK